MPDSRPTSSLDEVLREYGGAKVKFILPLQGNNGDRMILLGAEKWLSEGFRLVESEDEADVLVLNGGGGLCVLPFCGNLQVFKRFTLGYPSKPIVVLPSSYYWGDADLASCFEARTAPVYLLARENYSFARLQATPLPASVKIGLDDDMAFQLRNSPLIDSAKQVPSEGYILLVERFDVEHVGANLSATSGIQKFSRFVPPQLKGVARRTLDFFRERGSNLKSGVIGRVTEIYPEANGLPVVYNDVSVVTRNSFEDFVAHIAKAEVVVTTRLHVGIFAGMIGKRTFVLDRSTGYQKVKGIYEYSMKTWDNVSFLEV